MNRKRKRKNRRSRTKKSPRPSWGTSEDPLVLESPGISPLEWLNPNILPLREAVRREPRLDAWARSASLGENSNVTESRRQKMQDVSLSLREESIEKEDESVA